MKMDVSIIIVSYNTAAFLSDCIGSIIACVSGIQYEIIVVDNHSEDGSPEMVAREFPEIVLIRNVENVGFGKANNIGYKRAQGKYTLFLNSDTLLIDNAVKGFFDFMECGENQDVFACGGKLVRTDLDATKSYGNFPSFLENALIAFKIDRLLPARIMDRVSSGLVPKSSSAFDVDYIVGADLFLRNSTLGGELPFDEKFFLYFEETELCYRLKKMGYRAVIIPGISIIHYEGQSSGDDNKSYKYYIVSQLIFYKKVRGTLATSLYKSFVMALFMLRYLTSFNNNYLEKYNYYRKVALRTI